MKMRPISELLNLNVKSFFTGNIRGVICNRSETRKCIHGTNIDEFQVAFDKRLKSLESAIEIYRHKVLKNQLSFLISH
jgi:hypothetical protein